MNARAQTIHRAEPVHVATFARAGLLQRKCACGGAGGLKGECAECADKHQSLQRRATGPAAATVPPIVHDVLHSTGQPLAPAARSRMEARFGHDFSHVRVHTDARASASAQSVNALAYTVGRDIVFGGGQYAPETAQGQSLLAHELTHVLQQRHASGPPLASLELGAADDAGEREAETVAAGFASAEQLSISELHQPAGRIHRQPDKDDSEQKRAPIGRHGNAPLPYREAMEETTKGLYDEYQKNCEGVRVLERLERKEVTPIERVQGLERRLRVIPHLIRAKQMVKDEKDPIRHAEMEKAFQEQLVGEFPKFPPGYVLTTEEAATAETKCELSKARWELIMSVQHRKTSGSLLRK